MASVGELEQWVIFKEPKDAPKGLPYVVRRFRVIQGEAEPRADPHSFATSSLVHARSLIPRGLVLISRAALLGDQNDDPAIAEIWT